MRLKMVASKKIHCAICNKKCSGNVLRFQDQYYHKQCFELDAEVTAAAAAAAVAAASSGSPTSSSEQQLYQQQLQQQQSQQQSRQASASTSNIGDHYNRELPSRSSSRYQQSSVSPTNESSTNTINYLQQSDLNLSSSRQTLTSTSRQYLPSATNEMSNGTDARAQHHQQRGATLDSRMPSAGRNVASGSQQVSSPQPPKSATLPHSTSVPANGFYGSGGKTSCAGCGERITDGQALIALDLHWHVWCFKCTHCKSPLHGEYVAKDGRAYCERDYQKLFGVACVYCKRYITGKVLQAGEAHHFHPSCARCSKCGDPFVPGEEMYLQGEVTWHPRCGPGPEHANSLLDDLTIEASNRSQLRSSRAQSPSLSAGSRSRSVSPFSYMSRQGGRSSPGYADSEAVGDLSRVYTISYLNADPTQGYLRRPIEPKPPKSPQFSRPTSVTRSRSSSRSQHYGQRNDRSIPRGMYSVLSSMRSGSSSRARSPSMMNEEAIHLAQYPSGKKPSPDAVPKIERDDFPAPPFPYPERMRNSNQSRSQVVASGSGEDQLETSAERRHHSQQQRASRPRSREIVIDDDEDSSTDADPQLCREEKELSKIANGIGKVFLQTLKEREKLRAWKRANLDPRNASRTPSATRELPSRMRYENPLNASPSRDMDRPRPWEEDEATAGGEHSPTRTRSSLGRQAQASSQMSSSSYGYKVVQSNRSTPKPGYGLSSGPYAGSSTLVPPSVTSTNLAGHYNNQEPIPFNEQRRFTQNRSTDLLNRADVSGKVAAHPNGSTLTAMNGVNVGRSHTSSSFGAAHLRRSMPNVNLHHLHQEGPPKLYPYHLLATSNYRLPLDVDRCHLERHLSNEEFQYIFHCDRLYFYRLPEWKRNELKRRAKLF